MIPADEVVHHETAEMTLSEAVDERNAVEVAATTAPRAAESTAVKDGKEEPKAEDNEEPTAKPVTQIEVTHAAEPTAEETKPPVEPEPQPEEARSDEYMLGPPTVQFRYNGNNGNNSTRNQYRYDITVGKC